MKLITPNHIACGRVLGKFILLLCGMGLASACVEHSTTQYVPGYYSSNTYNHYPNYQGTRHRHDRDDGYYSSKHGTRNNYLPKPNNGRYYSNGSSVARYNNSSQVTTDDYYSSNVVQESSGDGGYSSSRTNSNTNDLSVTRSSSR